VALPKAVAGLSRASDVLVDQIKSIDNRRLRRKLGALPDPYLSELPKFADLRFCRGKRFQQTFLTEAQLCTTAL
jgi:hypothetical protein